MKIIRFLLFAMMTCTCTSNKETSVFFNLQGKDINKELYAIIKQYINSNKETNSFILITDFNAPGQNEEGIEKRNIYILGPLYDKLFDWGEDGFDGYPLISVNVNGKTVYIHSSMDVIIKPNLNKKIIDESAIPSEVSAYSKFISEAIVIEYSRAYATVITTKADTLYLKKRAIIDILNYWCPIKN